MKKIKRLLETAAFIELISDYGNDLKDREGMMTYDDLTINQKISIKGLIRDPKREGQFLSRGTMTYFKLLEEIAMLTNYKTAINHFLNKYVNGMEHLPHPYTF